MDANPVRSQDIVFRKIDNDSILVPIRSNAADLRAIFSLNEVGSRIWELADGERTVDDIASVLTEEYEIDPQTARADLDGFLGQLDDAGCLSWSQSDAG